MTDPAVTISPDHARRFLVQRHLLAPPRSLPAKPASVLKVVERLGLLQFDPIDVPGARNHDILLHARIAGYRRGWCEKWLYGDDRQLIELYNKSLNILPVSQLAHYRVTWELYEPRMGPASCASRGAWPRRSWRASRRRARYRPPHSPTTRT